MLFSIFFLFFGLKLCLFFIFFFYFQHKIMYLCISDFTYAYKFYMSESLFNIFVLRLFFSYTYLHSKHHLVMLPNPIHGPMVIHMPMFLLNLNRNLYFYLILLWLHRFELVRYVQFGFVLL